MAHRYDLHIHSRHSFDCLMRPEKIVGVARSRGLSGIAVTDHGTIAGGLEAKATAPDDFLVIVGAEIHTDGVGDIVGLFLKGEIKARDPLEVIADIHGQGGIAFLPHPLRSHRYLPRTVLNALDGYEVLNSRAGIFDPRLSSKESFSWQCLEGKARIGASDAHLYSEVGLAYTILSGPATSKNVRAQLLAAASTEGGARGPASNFYKSQLIRLLKTRDLGMITRFGRRLLNKHSPT